MSDPLEPHERQCLTVWCIHLVAQVQRFHTLAGQPYTQLAINTNRCEEDTDGCKIIKAEALPKLRALLNEAYERGYID